MSNTTRRIAIGLVAAVAMLAGATAASTADDKKGTKTDDKERALHFWGAIIEIDKSGHNFTVEGRWAFIAGENEKDEGKLEPKTKTDDRQRAHFIHLVTSGPAVHPIKLKFCCVEEKTTVWKLNGDPGHCRDLKEGAYVRVWVNGKCEKE